ncbi:MAG: alpha-amylase family glycosyl hydrolase, partial [Coriobacteriales bacterium]|nr:alpha-amylase family glycosyl hydrolase [Coriobacteriales bacterium]
MDIQNFYAGKEFFAHMWLGAHLENDGATFRTFAPAATQIQVILPDQIEDMQRVKDGNFWEAHVEGVTAGTPYEYRIFNGGSYTDHCDPYGYGMDLRPGHRSIVRELSYEWHDQDWMDSRSTGYDKPVNIYEMHLGSWRKRSGDQKSTDVADWYTYSEIAYELIPYLKEAGYTHVEFLPLNEHPLDASWGYQPTGFFSPTSRYGTAVQLMELIDKLHGAGIGAILDFVPVHFAVDEYGLGNYDGTALLEYPNDAVGVSEWGSYNFMHSRGETCSFLQSSANFWLGAYHFDGIRMDAISRIIYWQGDPARGVNANAVQFVREMNGGLKYLNQGIMLVAEDSTNYPGTTKPSSEGGLGFD